MSVGIYKYQNKQNGKIYIGQSVAIEHRLSQHIYDALNRPKYLIDHALNKYGVENFNIEIIELCSVEQLDERERFWIKYYNSYCEGYNLTPGGSSLRGEEHPRAILTENEVWQIRELYNLGIQRSKVFQLFQDCGISERGFKKVWDGETWTDIHMDVYTPENKALHKKQVGHSEDQVGKSSLDRAICQNEIDAWIEDFNNGMKINAIAKKYKRDNGTIQKYLSNPIAISKVPYKGRRVQNINTNKIFSSISSAAKWAKCGATTLTRHLVTDGIAGIVPETNEPAQWIELS